MDAVTPSAIHAGRWALPARGMPRTRLHSMDDPIFGYGVG